MKLLGDLFAAAYGFAVGCLLCAAEGHYWAQEKVRGWFDGRSRRRRG